MVESLEKILHSLETKNEDTSPLSETLQRSQLSLDINEILNLEFDDPNSQSTLEKPIQPEKIKCWPTLIGGTDLTLGCSRLVSPRACSALHCRDCDFPVSTFPDHEWTEDVEYLYLRINMPNTEKIKEKLIRRCGTVAYACHCVSFSTEQIQHVSEKRLPWFCRGHT